jgi:enamine deaminase RidA (YjgF/YER057c/UK114 family)
MERQRVSSGSPYEPKLGISRAAAPRDADAIAAAHAAVLGEVRPVSTMVVVTGFLDPRWKVEIEAEATLDG